MNMLRKAGLAVIFLFVSPAALAADPQTGGFDGFVSGALGYGRIEDNPGDEDDGLAREARISLAYTGAAGVGGQLDYGYFKEVDSGTRDIAGHLYYRSSGWLAGAFAQRRNYYIGGTHLDVKGNFLGIEGQGYFNRFTLYGQAGQTQWKRSAAPDSDRDYLATAELRYFVGPDFRVDGTLNYMRQKENYGYKWDQVAYGVGAEYRLPNRPLSLFGKYEYVDEGDNAGFDATNQRVLLGLKLSFGKASLRQSDRDGLSLKPVAQDLFW
jgi:hypothetical protein